MVSIWVAFAYVGFLVGSLALFSRSQRRNKRASTRQPWFSRHEERDIYVSLLSKLTNDDPAAPTPTHPLLTSALMRRAMVDVQRMNTLREAKAALTTLLAKGQIGDDLWNHLLDTEKELEVEIMEVVQEANAFRQGWGQSIFPHAGDMVAHEQCKRVFDDIEGERTKAREAMALRDSMTSAGLLYPAPLIRLATGATPANIPAQETLSLPDASTISRQPSPMPPADRQPSPPAPETPAAESSDEEDAVVIKSPSASAKKKRAKRKR